MNNQRTMKAPMRAVLFKHTGSTDGLVLTLVERPAPAANEVLVKIHTATVTRGDVVLRKLPFLVARVLGQRRKTMLGHEFAGEIEALGSSASRFSQGDRVFGTTTGLQTGSYAEYISVPEDGVLAEVPEHVNYEQAAAVPVGALTALHFLRKGKLESGKRVLVYGASGSVGTFAVQLAAAFGAPVTAVCSTANIEMVSSLGADNVIDYTRENFTHAGATYDVVFDAVGKLPSNHAKAATADGGAFVSVRSGSANESTDDLVLLRNLLEAGRLTSVIDRRFPLEEIREAHHYVEKGHKRGNVVITVTPSGS
jgi:NADPH:quinone reductase-like Zn-dependent oxidoreductase